MPLCGRPSVKRYGWPPTCAFLQRPTWRCRGLPLRTFPIPVTSLILSCGLARPGMRWSRMASIESGGGLRRWRFPPGSVEVEEGFAPSSLPPQGDGGIRASTAFGKALLMSAPEPEAKARLGRANSRSELLMSEVELLPAIPEVSDRWEVRSRWRMYRGGRWRWPEEHINIKEGRASIMALERHVWSAQQHHCRLFQLSDNLVSVLAQRPGPRVGRSTLCAGACVHSPLSATSFGGCVISVVRRTFPTRDRARRSTDRP